MKNLTIILGLILILTFGCEPKAPEGLSEEDKNAIREVTETALQIAREGSDWVAYTDQLYAPDAIILPPNAEVIKGRESIISFFNSFPPIIEMKFEHIEIGGGGGIAYVYGTYSLVMTSEGEEPITDNGKYIEIWKKQSDDSWKIALDIGNSYLPLVESEKEM